MIRDGLERRCKASKSEFEEIWPGVKRCLECGFALAVDDGSGVNIENPKQQRIKFAKEDSLHSTYHGKYYKAKSEYGSFNVLSYKELREMSKNILTSLSQIKNYDIQKDLDSLKENIKCIGIMLSEVDTWSKNLKNIDSSRVTMLYDSIQKNLKELNKFYQEMKKNKTNEELLVLFTEFLHPFFDLVSLFDDIDRNKKSHEYLEDQKIPDYVFSIDINSKLNEIENLIQTIPSKQGKVNGILDNFFRIEFTKSLRLWDMCKPHPKFEDYKVLLWNTPKFLDFIKNYMTDSQFKKYKDVNMANRYLVDFNFEEAPYYFGKVAETSYSKNSNIIDISYMDNIIAISEEDDDDTSDGYENTEDYKNSAKAFAVLGKVLNKS